MCIDSDGWIVDEETLGWGQLKRAFLRSRELIGMVALGPAINEGSM
jgi:hypothetical protein